MVSSPALFFIPFGVSLLALCMVERVLHIVLHLFASGAGKGAGIRGQLVIGSAVNLAASAVSGIASIFAQSLYSVGRLAFWFLILFCVTSCWYVVYEEHPMVVLRMVDYYNARVGPFVHAYLVMPLDMLNVLFKGIVPLYNGAVWIVLTLFRSWTC